MADLAIGYNAASTSPLLKFLLSKVDELKFLVPRNDGNNKVWFSPREQYRSRSSATKPPKGWLRFAGRPEKPENAITRSNGGARTKR
jgi:hypothetical protein